MVVKQSHGGSSISLERLSSASSSTLNNNADAVGTGQSAANKKLFESLLNGTRRRLVNNSTLSLNEHVTFELINAAASAVGRRGAGGELCDDCEDAIVQKSLPDLMRCSRDECDDKSSADDEVATSSSLSTSSTASRSANTTENDVRNSLSSSQESTRYLSSDDSSVDDAKSTSPSSRKSAPAELAVVAAAADEDEDGIVFSSDMTVIIDRGGDFFNTIPDDKELDEYSSRRETVTFTKIVYGSKSPSSSEPDNISTKSDKSLSNYMVNRDDHYSTANGASRSTKLVNSISDENIEALSGEPGSPQTPSAFIKTRADSSLLTTTSSEPKAPRALTKQSSFLSSGKSTISSAHSNSIACEVTSLSSMTSDYSQFEFLNNNNSSSQNPSTVAPVKADHVTSSSSSTGLTSFFFSNGLFGSGKKQKQLMSSTLATSEDKSVKLVVSSGGASAATPNQTTPSMTAHPSTESTTALSSRLDSFTNKLLNFKPSANKNSFNVTSPPASGPSSSNITKFFFSSSSNKTPQAQGTEASASSPNTDAASIKSNHSVNNLSTIVAGLQVPNSVLIFENRPSNLPAKSQQEALKHQREYEKMVESAKKKEQKEKEMKLKKYEQQMRKEDFMANSLKVWNQEILVNWAELKDARRTHQLWWHGLPPSIRGKVWRLAIGNELNLTKESYYHYERKAQEKLEILNKLNNSTDLNEEEKRAMCAALDQDKTHESSVELIKLDVSRTFPQLSFFQRDGPYHDALHGVLGAYACYNTKIGYVQGMSFLTAILLLNMEAPDAFICLSNLLNTKYLLACFCMNQTQMNRYFKAHQILLEHNLPKLYRHFEEQKVKPDLYLIEWIFTLFSKSLPLDVVSRVWDVFLRDHEEFLFRTALGILNLYKDTLLKMDFIHIVQFLTKLPENINSTQLFKSIEQISTTIDETYFTFNHLIGDI